MYSSYSPLQQSQLAAQGYYDTQSTYLLVYAPGRNTALRATSSLDDDLAGGALPFNSAVTRDVRRQLARRRRDAIG